MDRDKIIRDIMDIQAELQTPLGLYRLKLADEYSAPHQHDEIIEERLAKTLARLHKLLDELGSPMYNPAIHPDIWDGPSKIPCGAIDGEEPHIYGVCQKPKGHGGPHVEMRDDKLWSEWMAS